MRQVQGARLELQQALHRSVQLARIELRRRRRGEDEFARGGVEFTVADAEGVAGEDVTRFPVDDAHMMQCMPRRVHEFPGACAEHDLLAVGDGRDSGRRYGPDVAVQLGEALRSVHRPRGRDQARRIGQVRRAARVHQHLGAWQCRRQPAGPARMVQMNMGEHEVVDLGRVDVVLGQRLQQKRHRMLTAGVDEGGAAAVEDQMAGIHVRPHVAGVDGEDSVHAAPRRRSSSPSSAATAPLWAGAAGSAIAESRSRARSSARAAGCAIRAKAGW